MDKLEFTEWITRATDAELERVRKVVDTIIDLRRRAGRNGFYPHQEQPRRVGASPTTPTIRALATEILKEVGRPMTCEALRLEMSLRGRKATQDTIRAVMGKACRKNMGIRRLASGQFAAGERPPDVG